MAPEIWRDENTGAPGIYDNSVDIWAATVCFFIMSTGMAPFEQANGFDGHYNLISGEYSYLETENILKAGFIPLTAP